MAKVELDLPDDLLRQIDEAAARAGETRDEFLGRSVEAEVRRNQAAFRKEIEEMLGPPIHGGGGWAEWLRWDRDHRDDKKFGPSRDDG
ncbi:MAG TPA: hypothetical protein VGI17_17310 [Solirubrobacterales bacterium]|jgi:hypothetical protein